MRYARSRRFCSSPEDARSRGNRVQWTAPRWFAGRERPPGIDSAAGKDRSSGATDVDAALEDLQQKEDDEGDRGQRDELAKPERRERQQPGDMRHILRRRDEEDHRRDHRDKCPVRSRHRTNQRRRKGAIDEHKGENDHYQRIIGKAAQLHFRKARNPSPV